MPFAISPALARAGVESVTTQSAGRLGASDQSNMEWCAARGLTIVTHDRDYLRLAAVIGQHAGIAYCARRKYKRAGLIAELVRVARELPAEELADTVTYL